MKTTTKILFYSLYALIACGAFLYLLFPSDLLKEIITERLEHTQSNIEISVDHIRPTIPPGLQFRSLLVSYANQPLFRSDQVKLRFHLGSLFGGSKTVAFNGPLGSGNFSGRAETTEKRNRPQHIVNVHLSGVPLEAVDAFKQWPQYNPLGEIQGQIIYDSLKGATGTLEADVVISPARIVLDPPLMGLEVLEFSEIRAEISANQRQLIFKRFEVYGEQVEGKITGSIAFRQPMGSSRTNLSVTVKPQPAFISDHKNDMIGSLLLSSKAQKRGVAFQISGTLDNPSYVIR